ncbi:DNA/RNA polymerase [Neoconidiobolus thromboides FSU 785]|nr:DNA/RNA polymerase [Neoconidiobolus thromboides FSU 785]
MDYNQIQSILQTSKCIAHIDLDLDCFYCQVEQLRLGISSDTPLAVQQWQGLIAVNYAARAYKVERHSTPMVAKQLCPQIVFAHVPTYKLGKDEESYYDSPTQQENKASLGPYREASKKIMNLLQNLNIGKVQKASVDEAYLDITDHVNDNILNYLKENKIMDLKGNNWNDESNQVMDLEPIDWNDISNKVAYPKDKESFNFTCSNEIEDKVKYWKIRQLLQGAKLVSDIRKKIYDQLGFTCSSGISNNKLLAKITSSLNKPNGQILIPDFLAYDFLLQIPLNKIPSLGGKLGAQTKHYFGDNIGELRKLPLNQLQLKLGHDNGLSVYNLIRGISFDDVKPMELVKSIMSAKSFHPYVEDKLLLLKWIKLMCIELKDRLLLDQSINLRWPKQIMLHYAYLSNKQIQYITKSCLMPTYFKFQQDEKCFFDSVSLLMDCFNNLFPAIRLNIQLNGLETFDKSNQGIMGFINKGKEVKEEADIDEELQDEIDEVIDECINNSDQIDEINQGIMGFINKRKECKKQGNGKTDDKLQDNIEEPIYDESTNNKKQINKNSTLNKSINNNNSGSIMQGLNNNEESSTSFEDRMERCKKCKELINKEEMKIHLDYHFAIEFQKKMDQQEIIQNKRGSSNKKTKKEPKTNKKEVKMDKSQKKLIDYFKKIKK